MVELESLRAEAEEMRARTAVREEETAARVDAAVNATLQADATASKLFEARKKRLTKASASGQKKAEAKAERLQKTVEYTRTLIPKNVKSMIDRRNATIERLNKKVRARAHATSPRRPALLPRLAPVVISTLHVPRRCGSSHSARTRCSSTP